MDFPKSVPGVGLVAGRYVDENQATGQPGTLITAQAMNALTDEILAVVTDAGMDPDEHDNAQLRDAIKAIVGKETDGIGGLPRFTPYVWGGQAAAMPEGDTQSSGQQLTDLMYPTMRAQVTATQFTCTEAVWQADPYKRVTHWSLGDGAAWMRPPDKNGVQPGNVGAFYGVGANPAGAKPGTAVADAMQGHHHSVLSRTTTTSGTTTDNYAYDGPGGNYGPRAHIKAGDAISDGVNGDPRISSETRPRTWYGIWMIRMYGSVTNAGDLNAPALNARMDLIDARVSSLEAIPKPMGYQQAWVSVSRLLGVNYTNDTGRTIAVSVTVQASGNGASLSVFINDDEISRGTYNYNGNAPTSQYFTVGPGKKYRVSISGGAGALLSWKEER